MTPKEKALELIEGHFECIGSGYSGYYESAKGSALITVEEIVKVINCDGFYTTHIEDLNNLNYWDEVKQEIERYETK
jgi:hypothetical protein